MALPYVTASQLHQAIKEASASIPTPTVKKFYAYTLEKVVSEYDIPIGIKFISTHDLRVDTFAHLYEDLVAAYGTDTEHAIPAIGYDFSAGSSEYGKNIASVVASATANTIRGGWFRCDNRSKNYKDYVASDFTNISKIEL